MQCDECGEVLVLVFVEEGYAEYECPDCGLVTGFAGIPTQSLGSLDELDE